MLDTFFTTLKKTLIATVLVMFAFVVTYVPQPFNDVTEVEAGAAIGATEPTQIANNIQLAAVNVATTLSAGFDAVTSFATNNLWIKEYVLDGIGWAIAKRIVSSMVASLIDWINSGFQGSPAFVQDLRGFLVNVADEAIGEFIQHLGAIGSFICSPFRLDVQLAVALQYQQSRREQTAPTCTLTGIIDNIENFLAGSFSDGGYNDWFDIVANPQTYTPYGAILSAQADARARIINAQGEEITLLEFGDGFLSGEICELVSGPNGQREDCFITKPGVIIQEALSFNLDSGRQSLISADEINEIIAALLGQLANTVIQGAAGLLGLSGGTGYTYSGFDGGSYTSQVQTDSTSLIDYTAVADLMRDALSDQRAMSDLATEFIPRLEEFASSTNSDTRRTAVEAAIVEAETALQITTVTPGTIPTLESMIAEIENDATSEARRAAIIAEYGSLPLYSSNDVVTFRSNWSTLIR